MLDYGKIAANLKTRKRVCFETPDKRKTSIMSDESEDEKDFYYPEEENVNNEDSQEEIRKFMNDQKSYNTARKTRM